MTKKINTTAALIANSKALSRLKTTLTVFLALLTIWGIIGFGLFILEEASQVLMFSQWAAADVNRWDIIMEGTDLMKKTNDTSKVINKYLGWVNPISYMSYKAYADATDIFIKAALAKVLANEPSLFIGRNVGFSFKPKRTENLSDGSFAHTNRNIKVLTQETVDDKGYIRAVGILEKVGNKLIVDMTRKE